jgi:pSer/pThr/pTyr-binding forkhead associated (FHA) protein
MESVTAQKVKLIHVIKMNRGSSRISIGRGKDADLKISDISVSRMHASIFCDNLGHMHLKDEHSKFGTLALV